MTDHFRAPLPGNPFMPGLSGIRLLTYPDRPPRLERETFSGGRNLSAAERNCQRLRDAKRVYRMTATGDIVVPSWFYPEFVEELERGVNARLRSQKRVTDDDIDQMYWELHRLDEKSTRSENAARLAGELAQNIEEAEQQRADEILAYAERTHGRLGRRELNELFQRIDSTLAKGGAGD